MRHHELSEDADIHELAADLNGLWAVNRVILARSAFRDALAEVGGRLQRVTYRSERPDVASAISRVLARGHGDCEDLCAAWHAWIKAVRGPDADVVSLLTPGGEDKQFHCFLRVAGQTFDPSVRGGMPRPPDRIYVDPRAVVIAA